MRLTPAALHPPPHDWRGLSLKKGGAQAAVAEWSAVPTRLRDSIRGLTEEELDLRGGEEGWSIREGVHHLVEANLVASNMIIAALATDGGPFDWTWVNPNRKWMGRVGYDTARVEPAIAMLAALCQHISELLLQKPSSLERIVSLNDAPGAPRYDRTVEEILRQEIEHAGQHIGDIRDTRAQYSR